MSSNLPAARTPDKVYAATSRPLYFISDLHLSETLSHTVAAFEHFIANTVQDAGALYILGDFFEAWVGDDLLTMPFMQPIVRSLTTLADRGIPLYVMHGNRDFLLGERFAHATQAQLIQDPCVIEAFGIRVVLTHGDILCTADHAYQRFRKIVRCRAVQRFFNSWPLAWRLALAARLRAKSRATGTMYQKNLSAKMDVTNSAVNQLFTDAQATTMIHGHTHRPAQHQYDHLTRWVLPDWDVDHDVVRGGYLRLDQNGIQAISII